MRAHGYDIIGRSTAVSGPREPARFAESMLQQHQLIFHDCTHAPANLRLTWAEHSVAYIQR